MPYDLRTERAYAAAIRRLTLALVAATCTALASAAFALADGGGTPQAPAQGPPNAAPPGAGPTRLAVTSGIFENGELVLQLQCGQNGSARFTRTGSASIVVASTGFSCSAYHTASLSLRLGSQLQRLASSGGLQLVVDVRSGVARVRVPVTLQAATQARSTQSAARVTGFDQMWNNSDAYCMGSGAGAGRGGQVVAGPAGYASLGAHSYGERVYWRAWLYWVNPATGQNGWSEEPGLGDNWHYYNYLPNGATASGQGINVSNQGVTVMIGGTTAPGVAPAPARFTVNSGFYVMPVIESWSQSNGDAWNQVRVTSSDSATVTTTNYCLFG
jgi:hypothetical protein